MTPDGHPKTTDQKINTMLLLETSKLRLCEFAENPPPYITFSAAWGADDIVHDDLRALEIASQKPGFKVLLSACLEARNFGCQWLWSDAVCINRRSSAALSESLNSLAQIYRHCMVCIVYLGDFASDPVFDAKHELQFPSCNWGRDVWTLPHLIFPSIVYFYDCNWVRIGTKSSFLAQISHAISIDQAVLEDSKFLEDFSIGRRMSWAAGLAATRLEDVAYSLLGIFNVNMPIIYGEGRNAYLRLQEEILKDTDDYSLFAWRPREPQEYRGIYAHSPSEFLHFKFISQAAFRIDGDVRLRCDGVKIRAKFKREGDDMLMPLHCCDGSTTWIVLSSMWDRISVRRSSSANLDAGKPINNEVASVCVKRDVTLLESQNISKDRDRTHHGTSRKQHIIGYNETEVARKSSPGQSIASVSAPVAKGDNTPASTQIAWSQPDTCISSWAGSPPYVLEERTRSTVHHANGMTSLCSSVGFDDLCNDYSVGSDKDSGGYSSRSEDGMSETDERYSEVPAIEPAHAFMAVVGDLIGVVVERFSSQWTRTGGKRLKSPWPQRARKRPKSICSGVNSAFEPASNSEDDDIVIVRHVVPGTSVFACPFYLNDKKSNQHCLTRHHLQSIGQVKEHLWEVHRRPSFCPICKDTFATTEIRDNHIRNRSCEKRPPYTFDGITDSQVRQLAQLELSSLPTREHQWFALWDVVFPQKRRPAHPYYSTEQELGICAFRRFWQTNGHVIVSDFLKEKDLQEWNVPNEERNLGALYDTVLKGAIDGICTKYSEVEVSGAKRQE